MRPPSSTAASRSATLIGRSASGVCASPSSFSAPRCAQAPVRVEGAHDVGGREAFALEQLPDEPRARELARDVVLQVGVQAPVARVELGRRADREHRGLQQVEAERARRRSAAARRRRTTLSPCVSRSATSSEMYSPRNGSPGSGSEPATRSTAAITRRSMKPKRDLGRATGVISRHGVRLVLHGVARVGDGERAARRRAALLDDVRELVRDQPVAVRRVGLVLVLREVDVGAGRERPRGHGVVEVVRRRVGVHADIREVAERGRELVRDAVSRPGRCRAWSRSSTARSSGPRRWA